jgi:ankyrin repeat protein
MKHRAFDVRRQPVTVVKILAWTCAMIMRCESGAMVIDIAPEGKQVLSPHHLRSIEWSLAASTAPYSAIVACCQQLRWRSAKGKNMSTALLQALTMEDVEELVSAIKAGADVNDFVIPNVNRPLTLAVESFQCPAQRLAALHILLAAGADPKLLDDDEEFLGPLFSAMLVRDAASLQILLAAGADPCLEHRGAGETLYEATEFDYLIETWMMELPEQPTEADKVSEEAWLGFLTRIAVKHGKPEPDCMSVLWSAGARRSPRKSD